MSTHVYPVRAYLGVFFALILLTAATVAAAYADLGGHWNDVVALTIATAKAAVVALFFMHLGQSRRLTWLLLASGLFWLAVLIAFTMSDVATRGGWPS